MSIRELFSQYDKFTTAAELSASRGQSLRANRVTTTPALFPVAESKDGALRLRVADSD